MALTRRLYRLVSTGHGGEEATPARCEQQRDIPATVMAEEEEEEEE